MNKSRNLVKRLLLPIVLSGALLGGYLAFDTNKKKNELDNYAQSIRNQGHQVDQKIFHRNAESILINILQKHEAHQGVEKALQKSLEEASEKGLPSEIKEELLGKYKNELLKINPIQEEIYKIVFDLSKHSIKPGVYLEGLAEDTFKVIDNSRKEANRLLDIIRQKLSPEQYKKAMLELEKKWEDRFDNSDWLTKYQLLHIKKEINLHPAEDKSTNEEASRYLIENMSLGSTNKNSHYNHLIYTNREAIAMNYVGNGKEKVRVLIYGAHHNFEDDVKRWKEKNKDRKMNLLVVTPKTLRK
jgi:hypothetical protein